MQPEIDSRVDGSRIGVEFWEKVEKKNICSNGQKEEASRIGAKSQNRGKSPNARKGEASRIGAKSSNRGKSPNDKKKEASRVGGKKQKKEELLQ